jgi:hypothetical protein
MTDEVWYPDNPGTLKPRITLLRLSYWIFLLKISNTLKPGTYYL